MSRNGKIVLSVLGVIAFLGAGLVFAAGAKVYSDGLVRVRVHEKDPGGVSISLPVPVSLVTFGVGFIPARELEEMRREIGPWMPAIEALCEELSRIPDGPLVEVETPDEKVSIRKKGVRLVIDVETSDEEVHVSLPLTAIDSVLHRLEGSRHGLRL